MVSDLVNELRQHTAGADFQSLMDQAASAIERQAKNLRDCRNELCFRCGAYKERHNGACDGCRWKDVS